MGRLSRAVIRSRAALFAAVWLFAFGLYATTASPYLHGYDPQAANSAQGFFETGRFEMPRHPLYGDPGDPGADGKRVSRVGLPEAGLMVPFYAVGAAFDDLAPRPEGKEPFRALALGFYEPWIAAIAAALLALIVLRITRSVVWAIVIAVLFTIATIAWPYSKIGMETTVMLGLVLTVAGVVHARAGTVTPWLVAGVGAGMTIAGKAYEALAVAALLGLLVPVVRSAPREQRLRLVAAVAIPLAVSGLAIGWYNWTREGSPFDFGQAGFNPTLAAPVNAVGFYVSPGKGLFWYSPLVILGLLGLRELATTHRRLALALIGAVVAGTAVVAVNTYWTDETWGPRYIVPVAWLLLLPLPFWAVTRRRQAVLAGVAAIAVVIQLIGVIAPYESTVATSESLLGPTPAATRPGDPPGPLGHDAVRWVPGLSPLLDQGALVASWAGTSVGMRPLTLKYAPYEGTSRQLEITRPLIADIGIPDFWWLPRKNGPLGLFVLLPLLTALLSALALTRAAVEAGAAPAWMSKRLFR